MKIDELAARLGAEILNFGEDLDVTQGYAGDFLSNVIGKAPEKCAWFTVMANANVAAVAMLTDVGVVVLCENVEPDADLLEKVKTHQINLLKTPLGVFSAVKAFVEK